MSNPILERARVLAGKYRDSVADLVAIIAEVNRLRLYADAGYPSLFEYCVKDLLLSEDDAYKMIQSAKAANRQPEILSFLSEGSLSARAVALLVPESGKEGFIELLDSAKGKTVREVEKMVAARNPEAPARDIVRPKAAGVFRVSFDADEDLRALLERARGLLRHKYPEGTLEAVIKEALGVLVRSVDPLEGDAAKPRLGARSNPHARQAPPAVKDAVWRRDDGRCTFVAQDGRRCEATSWLEVDHITPWAQGGLSDDPANLRLLCRAHNQLAARRAFGGPT